MNKEENNGRKEWGIEIANYYKAVILTCLWELFNLWWGITYARYWWNGIRFSTVVVRPSSTYLHHYQYYHHHTLPLLGSTVWQRSFLTVSHLCSLEYCSKRWRWSVLRIKNEYYFTFIKHRDSIVSTITGCMKFFMIVDTIYYPFVSRLSTY